MFVLLITWSVVLLLVSRKKQKIDVHCITNFHDGNSGLAEAMTTLFTSEFSSMSAEKGRQSEEGQPSQAKARVRLPEEHHDPWVH